MLEIGDSRDRAEDDSVVACKEECERKAEGVCEYIGITANFLI